MKVGIITEISYSLCNFGNACQAYALNHFISKRYNNEVYTIELEKQSESITSFFLYSLKKIKYNLKKRNSSINFRKLSDRKKGEFYAFFTNYVHIKHYQRLNDIEKDRFEAFVVGADVVWHQEHAFINSLKFLDLKCKNIIKLSYAASFGNDWIPKENENKIKRCLNDFSGISVREESSVELLDSINVKNVTYVLDPVFLLSRNEWSQIEKRPKIENKYTENFCLIYLLTPKLYEIEFANKLLDKYKLSGIIVSYTDDAYDGIEIKTNCRLYNECSPQEWLWLFDNCKYIITDSFHGLAFSVIFEKKFFVMNRKSMMNRLIDFIKHIGSEDLLIYENYEDSELEKEPDYRLINNFINQKKKHSFEYLDKFFKDW